VGYGIASDESLVHMLDRVRTPFNVNLAAQTAALAAWNDIAYMQQCVRDTVAQREWLATQLRTMGVVMAPSATNFLFLDLQRPNGPVAEALLTRGVVVKPWKEPGYERFIRVSIASVADNALFLKVFTEAMRDPA
jgi:histidinol-phosphate aminotransferase